MEKSSSQGRFFVLENGPVVSPGECAVCRCSDPARRYLDPQILIEFYGSVIFCETCVISMAQEFGLLTAEKVGQVEAERDAALTELVKLNAVSAAMEDLSVAVRAYTGESGLTDGGNPLSLESNSAVSGDDESSPIPSEGVSDGEPTFDVTGISQGPDDLSSIGSSDRSVFGI